jgi:hypothetical protein
MNSFLGFLYFANELLRFILGRISSQRFSENFGSGDEMLSITAAVKTEINLLAMLNS